MHKEITLSQKTQKRHKEHDCPPFICYDGENVHKNNPIDVRCWTGLGLVVYAGGGVVSVRGNSEPMDQDEFIAFDAVTKAAYQYAFNPSEEE